MRVICISGKAQHGKDTTAHFLKEALEADGNKVLVTHYGDLVKFVCTSFFGWNGEKDEAGRHLLQYIGTDVVRKKEPDYWVKFIGDILKFFPDAWDYVLIPDCRFPNEIEYLRTLDMDVIHARVIRSNFESPLTAEQQNHPSEVSLDYTIPDYYVNNFGTLDDLRNVVSIMVTEIQGFHQLSISGV